MQRLVITITIDLINLKSVDQFIIRKIIVNSGSFIKIS